MTCHLCRIAGGINIYKQFILQIPYSLAGRRKGDIDCSYADPSLAEKELEWKAKYDLDDMCKCSCYPGCLNVEKKISNFMKMCRA